MRAWRGSLFEGPRSSRWRLGEMPRTPLHYAARGGFLLAGMSFTFGRYTLTCFPISDRADKPHWNHYNAPASPCLCRGKGQPL